MAALIETMEELLHAVRAHGLELTSKESALDETGADFLVAHAVDEHGIPWVVRTPRRPDVMARAASEHRALTFLQAQLPVAVPNWRVFSPEVIAYQRLSGNPAAVVDMSVGDYVWRFDKSNPPAVFLESLATALAALHAIDAAAASAAGLRVLQPADSREQWAGLMARARDVLTVPDSVWQRWQTWIADLTYWPEHSVLVHGDLHPAHILINDEQRVTGLLDWTEAHVGDPATDFALQFATLGSGALTGLLTKYEEAGGRVWPRMREHVVEMWSAYPVMVATFAIQTGEEAHRMLGQALVDNTAREMPNS